MSGRSAYADIVRSSPFEPRDRTPLRKPPFAVLILPVEKRPVVHGANKGYAEHIPDRDNTYVWPVILPTIRFTPSTIDFATFADTASPRWIAALRTLIHSRMLFCSISVINAISSA